jgi:hypothetical protein
VFETGGHVSVFIYPFEQVAAEQGALFIHVFRLYQFTVIHIRRTSVSSQNQ